jgi:predicted transposase YdaD
MAGHDGGYRHLFSFPRMVADLLREFVREPWVSQLDFSTLERVSGSFVSEDLQQRYNDVAWRLLWRRDGLDQVPVYVLVEFQSTPYRYMAVRLLTYLALLYEHLIRHRAGVGKVAAGAPHGRL